MNQKNEQLETKIDSLKTEILELTKTKTFRMPSCPSLEEECSDKFIIKNKYSTRIKERKDSDLIINTEEKKESELTPENYDLIKVIKLKNNLKWYLFKKLKIKSNPKNNNQIQNNQIRKSLSRRFRYYSHKKDENVLNESNENNQSNDSYSNYLWKPQKNRKEFVEFCLNNKETSEDKQKKIENLEKNLKEMEEKLDKREKDFNRLNLNYAKMINKTKRQENNNNEELMEKLEKTREENKKLKNTINKYKSEQQFIGISFIEDLEGEQFIDDKCFEEILDGLINENKEQVKEKNEKKKEKEKKEKINFFNYGKNNFYFESKLNYEKSCINTMNTINTNNTINNPSTRHIGARGFYKSKRKNGE